MVSNTNKRSHDDDEHKDIVIENVEFCMMQFYKSQFEAAQARIASQQKQLKKQKRELEHKDATIRIERAEAAELNEQLEHTIAERDYSYEQLSETQDALHVAIIAKDSTAILLTKCEDRFMNTMTAIQNHFANHPELPVDDFRPFITAIEPSAGYDSDEETEPDFELQEYLLNEEAPFNME